MSQKWRDRWRKARRLSAADWLVFAEATFTLSTVRLALARGAFEEVRVACTEPAATNASPLPIDELRRIVRLADAAANCHPLRLTCLPRALTVARMLRRRQVAATVKIGARREGNGIDAHAWVELNGEPLLDPGSPEAPFHVLTLQGETADISIGS